MNVTPPADTQNYAVYHECWNAILKISDFDQTWTADLYSRSVYSKHTGKDLKTFILPTSIFDKRLVLDTNKNFVSRFQ